jgi:hypothetical protein
MKKCRWFQPRLVAAIEFLEWTQSNQKKGERPMHPPPSVQPNSMTHELLD